MFEGWHLVSAALDSKDNWRYMLGRPDVGLEYNDDTDTYRLTTDD